MRADNASFPPYIVAGVVAICVLPSLLNLLGADFGIEAPQGPLTADAPLDAGWFQDELHQRLRGSFVHTILEWSAFGTALLTACLALIHYRITGDVVTPIIGVALFCAGTMDAFHTLVADRLLTAQAHNAQFIPFTWALSRLFHAVILIAGPSLFLLRRPGQQTGAATGGIRLVLLVSLMFGVVSFSTIVLCATAARLPETYFPDWIVKRPWDAAPLILYLAAGGFVLPRLRRRHPSLFSHALLISIIPNVAAQLHAAFGSTALFDNHFNIAEFLKIVAYLVPLLGLMLDYKRTYRCLENVNTELEDANAALEKTNVELEHEVGERKRAEERLAERAEELARSKVRSMQDAMKRDREERIDQAQRATQAWLRVAREIRQRLLPSDPPPLPGFELSGVCRPGENPGGDYFDYIPFDDGKVGVIIGDVGGRGMNPSLRMAEIRAFLRAMAEAQTDPGALLTHVDRLLARSEREKRPVTLLLARIDPDTRSLVYAAAGRTGYLVDTQGEIKKLESTSPPLGLGAELTVPSAQAITMKPGELLVLLTDGLAKAVSAKESQFGLERVLEIVRAERRQPADDIVDALNGAAGSFAAHAPLEDDITIVVLKATAES